MSQWYLSKQGQAIGPMSEDKMISLIKEGEVKAIDLIYQAGATEWLPIVKVEPFSRYLSQKFSETDAAPSGEWVLLKKVSSEKGSEFKQLGPVSDKAVLQMLEKGSIRFADFAWKKGMENWVKISEIQEFLLPLPSSPVVDENLYAKSENSADEITRTEKSIKLPLTELIHIERFEHEKTQIQKKKKKVKSESRVVVDDEVTEAPSAAPLSDVTDGQSQNSLEKSDEVSLWSLKPPVVESSKGDEKEKRPVKQKKNKKKAKPIKAEKKNTQLLDSQTQTKTQLSTNPHKEKLQWAGAIAAVLIAALFFYKSFQNQETEIAYDNSVITEKNTDDLEKVMPSIESKVESSVKEVVAEKKDVEKKQALTEQPSGEKEKSVKPPLETVLQQKNKTQAEVVDKKTKIKQQVTVLKNSKNSVKTQNSSQSISSQVLRSATGPKASSYYKHRDRLALFYSALRAESLAGEIAKEYKKLRNNKKSWNLYYSKWKKKVNSALAREIKEFPKKKEIYAFPKQIESFKKDYNQFFKYGESFNSRVQGKRLPSGVPKEFEKLFTKHKSKAQNLHY